MRAAAEIYFGIHARHSSTVPPGRAPGRADRESVTLRPDVASQGRRPGTTQHSRSGRLESHRGLHRPRSEDARVTRRCPSRPPGPSPSEWQPTNYFIEEVRRQLLDDPRLGADPRGAVRSGSSAVASGSSPPTTPPPRPRRGWLSTGSRRLDRAGLRRRRSPRSNRATGKVRGDHRRARASTSPGFGEFNIATQGGRPHRLVVQDLRARRGDGEGTTCPPTRSTGPGHVSSSTTRAGQPGPLHGPTTSAAPEGSVRSRSRSQTHVLVQLRLPAAGSDRGPLQRGRRGPRPRRHRPTCPRFRSRCPSGRSTSPPLDMAVAYATIANDGLQVDPIFIERVEDPQREPDLLQRAGNPSGRSRPSRHDSSPSILEDNVEGGHRHPRPRCTGPTRSGQDRNGAGASRTPGSSDTRPTCRPRCGWAIRSPKRWRCGAW